MRAATPIRILARAVDEAERVCLREAADGRIVVAVPVVVQALFERRFGCPQSIRAASWIHWPSCRRQASKDERASKLAVPVVANTLPHGSHCAFHTTACAASVMRTGRLR